MKHIFAQAVKELTQLRRDRLTLALAFLFPLGLLALYGKAITMDVSGIAIAIEDLDHSPLSRGYIESLAATQRFRVVVLPAARRAEAPLDAGDVRAVAIIPPHFDRDARRGAEGSVQVLVDGTDANTATVIRASIQAITQAFRARLAPEGAALAASGGVSPQIRLWYNPGLEDEKNFAPGALALVLIMTPSMLTALAMAREPEQGTLIQVYASNLTAAQWLAGKALAYYVIAMAQFAATFAMGTAVFGFRFAGNPAPLVAGTVIYLACAVFLGLWAGVIMNTQSAALQVVQFVAFLFSLLLSGFIFPVANIPAAIRWIALFVPARYYIDLARDAMLRGSGWDMAALPLVALALLTLLFFFAAWGRLRRMQFRD